MRVLVVEDERLLADAVAAGLHASGVVVDTVYDGASALARLAAGGYDVLVLDRDLPRVPGDEVCRRVIAAGGVTRVLMLTAASDVGQRVGGLELGADDYLTKPFALAELRARVHALHRRARPATPPVLERHGIRLDTSSHAAYRGGMPLALSHKEFAILEELLRADGGVVSAEHLLEKAWDEHTDPFTNTVRVTVMKLRRKLGRPDVVHTVAGTGYRIP